MCADVPCFQRLPSYAHSSRVVAMAVDTLSGNLSSPNLLAQGELSVQYVISPGGEPGHVTISIGGEEVTRRGGGGARALDQLNITVGCPGHEGAAASPANFCTKDGGGIFTFELGPVTNGSIEVEAQYRLHSLNLSVSGTRAT